MQRCVDETNHVVDQSFCMGLPAGGAQSTYTSGGGGGGSVSSPHSYRYYYGGSGSYEPGTAVSEGSFTPSSGHAYSTTTGTARGGFGSSFSGEGGGHGGGGE